MAEQPPIENNEKQQANEAKHLQQVEKLRKRKEQERQKSSTQMLVGICIAAMIGGIGIFAVANMPHSTSPVSTPPPEVVDPVSNYNRQDTFNPSHLSKMPDNVLQLAGLLTGLAAVIGGGLFAYTRFTRRKYVQFDKIGILISDSPKPGEGDARFIPWGCLYSIDVVYPEKQQAPDIQDEGFATIAREHFATADPQLVFYVDDGSTVKLNWRDLIACTEAGSFINALKTWAPDALGGCKLPGEEGLHNLDKNNYTQLWFKYYSQSSDRKRTAQLMQGETLQDGRYTIAGRLGSGGQGTAYLTVDNQPTSASSAPDVVLKEYILPVHRGQQVLEQTVEKLRREADILRKIDHPNIVRMLGEFVEDHRGYLVMEYVAGRSLKALVAQEGKLPEETVKKLALQICDILQYLHGKNPPIIHRDLTPDNLILQDDGIVKLVDFNVAHQLESQATATVVGKHCYIPPEQFRGRPTPGSDIYAFGCTMFYLLTGEEPEPLTVSRPREKNEAVSEELNYLVAACTSMDANKRISTATEVKRILDDINNNGATKDPGAKLSLKQEQRIEA
ncbi:MAG TPA: serine/threonine-protein kinase [Candidatus Obscuribacterales bacterium]